MNPSEKKILKYAIRKKKLFSREQKRNGDVVAGARASQRNDENDHKKPIGSLGSHAIGCWRTLESRLLPVEWLHRRLGHIRQRENPFRRANTYGRQQRECYKVYKIRIR